MFTNQFKNKGLFPFLIVLGLIGSGCSSIRPSVYQTPPTKELFYTRVVIDYAKTQPELLSFAGFLEPFGVNSHNYQLTKRSIIAQKARITQFKRDLSSLLSYPLESPRDSLNASILKWYLSTSIEEEKFLEFNAALNPLFGAHIEVPTLLINQQTIRSAQQARAYLSRLHLLESAINVEISDSELAFEKGYLHPKRVLQSVKEQIQPYLSIENHPILIDFQFKIQKNVSIRRKLKEQYLQELQKCISRHIIPVYKKLDSVLDIHYRLSDSISCLNTHQLGKLKYAHSIEWHTQSRLNSDSIIELGYSLLDSIHEEIKLRFAFLGIDTSKSIPELYERLDEFPISIEVDNPPNKLISFLKKETQIQIAKEYVKRFRNLDEILFKMQVEAKIDIRKIPQNLVDSKPIAYYEPPSFDRTRPGLFFIQSQSNSSLLKYQLATLVAHEAIPGHHYQATAMMFQPKVPLFRKLIPFSAFVEGWALYAEQLVFEYGGFLAVTEELGYLQAEVFRICRLIVDVNLHSNNWTIDQACEFLISNTGISRSEAYSEAIRYTVQPGQALAYTLGKLKILSIRSEWEKLYGSNFNIAEFNSYILSKGSLPLHLLR